MLLGEQEADEPSGQTSRRRLRLHRAAGYPTSLPPSRILRSWSRRYLPYLIRSLPRSRATMSSSSASWMTCCRKASACGLVVCRRSPGDLEQRSLQDHHLRHERGYGAACRIAHLRRVQRFHGAHTPCDQQEEVAGPGCGSAGNTRDLCLRDLKLLREFRPRALRRSDILRWPRRGSPVRPFCRQRRVRKFKERISDDRRCTRVRRSMLCLSQRSGALDSSSISRISPISTHEPRGPADGAEYHPFKGAGRSRPAPQRRGALLSARWAAAGASAGAAGGHWRAGHRSRLAPGGPGGSRGCRGDGPLLVGWARRLRLGDRLAEVARPPRPGIRHGVTAPEEPSMSHWAAGSGRTRHSTDREALSQLRRHRGLTPPPPGPTPCNCLCRSRENAWRAKSACPDRETAKWQHTPRDSLNSAMSSWTTDVLRATPRQDGTRRSSASQISFRPRRSAHPAIYCRSTWPALMVRIPVMSRRCFSEWPSR